MSDCGCEIEVKNREQSRVRVCLLDSRYPDIIIGLNISVIVRRGGFHIMADTSHERQVLAESGETTG